MPSMLAQLQEFGLTEIEAKIYLCLLELKESTVLEVARKTAIKRATVHFNIENLIGKGLVSQTRKNSKRLLIAENPENLTILLEKRKSDISKLEGGIGSLVSALKTHSLKKVEGFSMQVKYFEGRDAVKAIYNDSLNAKVVRSYVNLQKVASVFPENQERFVSFLQENSDLELYEIVDDSSISKSLVKLFSETSANYKYKFVPAKIKLSAADVLIYDGKVAVINLGEQTAGMILDNYEYFEISKEIFEYLWSTL